MLWIAVAILAYFLFAAVFLIDKYLLTGPISSPKVFTFYTGVLKVFVVLLIPFVDFSFPGFFQLVLSFLAGGFFLWATFWFFKGLHLYEPSRVVPAIGGILPVFTFLIVLAVSLGQATLKLLHVFALAIIIIGSVLVSYEQTKKVSLESLKTSIVAALLFAVSFVLAKYVYLAQPFFQGLIWITLGGFFLSLFLLFAKEVRENLFQASPALLQKGGVKVKMQKKTATIFVSSQGLAAAAGLLQNWAVALAPLAYIAVVNALQGMQYVFLLIFAALISVKFPRILKEEVSKEVIFQKLAAILLIGVGGGFAGVLSPFYD